MQNIAVIGVGYVGLASGAVFAEFGNNVICCDVDEEKINGLKKGHIPIYEDGLAELVERTAADGLLNFTTDIGFAVNYSDIIFIAVGTPPAADGTADLSYVYEVARGIGQHINGAKIVVDKSTVPVGTSKKVAALIREEQQKRGTDYPFEVVSNPEFLREGTAMYDLQNPDRVIIGCNTYGAYAKMLDVYRPLLDAGVPFLGVLPETAEVIKYASNAFLAVKIAYINEIANLCEKVGADVTQVAAGMGSDKRISPMFLQAGPGFGGSCFPKDTQAICSTARDNGVSLQIVEAAIAANEGHKSYMVDKIERELGGVSGKKIAVFGVTFKPNTDDMRDSPALVIVPALVERGARVHVCDPQCAREAPQRFAGHMHAITLCADEYRAAEEADAIVLLTHWDRFKGLDYARVFQSMKGKHFFDLRNLFSGAEMEPHGFTYISVGR